ncbi:MAG: hypothetical protein U9P63_02650 [Patescibacteria group bacterium]|nr:hypothetical protein [Patescibacteria group bacterium]
MSEKQTIGGIAPKTFKSVPIAEDKIAGEQTIRTMQKDIDSLRERGFVKLPQNLPLAEEGVKKPEVKAELQKEMGGEISEKKEKEIREQEKREKIQKKTEEKLRERKEKEQRKKEEDAKKKIIREQKKKARAIKIAAFKARLKAKSPVLLRFSLMGVVALSIIGIIASFAYWWKYIRVITPPIVATHYECQDFQCVSVEGEGADQCQTEKDCAPAEPEIPQSLVPVSGTETIEIKARHRELFIKELELILAKDGEGNALNNVLIKAVSRTERKYIGLSDFLFLSEASLPEKIIQSAAVDESGGANYSFFFYNQAKERRLGFALKIAEGIDIREELKMWESEIPENITALFVNLEDITLLADTEEFQDNTYKSIAIRYINFPNPDLSVDYAIVGDKLIITTSRESMYAVIDALLANSPAR